MKIFCRHSFEFVPCALGDCIVNIRLNGVRYALHFEIKPQNSTSQKVLVSFQVVNAVRAINKLLGLPRDLSDDS
jgi:hypothetical protein